jgi:hypothetical protein
MHFKVGSQFKLIVMSNHIQIIAIQIAALKGRGSSTFWSERAESRFLIAYVDIILRAHTSYRLKLTCVHLAMKNEDSKCNIIVQTSCYILGSQSALKKTTGGCVHCVLRKNVTFNLS